MTKTTTIKYTPNQKGIHDFEKALDDSLQLTALKMVGDIQKITPRDKDRLPNNINRKDGQAPRRQGGVVNIGGNFYPQVTGSLKRSIAFQRVHSLSYKVGSAQAGKNSKTGEQTNAYGMALEFGTKHMKPRSFLRKGILDNVASTNRFFANQLKQRLK